MEVNAVSKIEQGIVIVAGGAFWAGLAGKTSLTRELKVDWGLRDEQGGEALSVLCSEEQREGVCVCRVMGQGKMNSRRGQRGR